jgi:hypothetical protein
MVEHLKKADMDSVDSDSIKLQIQYKMLKAKTRAIMPEMLEGGPGGNNIITSICDKNGCTD